MRIGTKRRAGRAVLALLVGVVAGGWVGGGLMYVFNRSKHRDAAGEVGALTLPRASEFDLVPADAAGFVHVRAADLWQTPAFDDYRRMVGKAGADALKTLDDSFVPAPSTIDRATLVVLVKPGRGGAPVPNVPPGKGAIVPPGKGGFAPPGKGGPVPPPPPPPPPPPLGAGGGSPDTDTVVLLTFNAAFDPVKVREGNLPRAVKQAAGEHEMWVDGGTGLAFHGDRTVIVGGEWAVRSFLTHKKTPDGPLAPTLKLAADGRRHVVGAMNLKAYRPPQDLTRDLPPEASALWRADALALGVVVGRGMRLDVRAAYKDADASEAAEKELRKAAEAGRKSIGEMKPKLLEALSGRPGAEKPRPAKELPEAVGGLFGLGALGLIDEWLANPPLERDGPEISATLNLDTVTGTYASVAALSAGFMLPAVQKVREAAGRAQEGNNLKQMGLALHSHHDVNGRFPAAAITTPPNAPRGRPLLSWRVAILPYLGEQALYQQFKTDEPWDSEHNKQLLPLMPKVYASTRAPAAPGMTYYQVFTTPETAQVKTLFGQRVGRRVFDATDGLSNTLMVVEAAEPVEWTRPTDLPFDADGDPPPLGPPGAGTFSALLGDGSVRVFPANTRPDVLRIWIGANDGIPNPPN